jgi:hypothetical protein
MRMHQHDRCAGPAGEAGGLPGSAEPSPHGPPGSWQGPPPPEAWQGVPPAGYGWPPAPPSRLSRFFTTLWTRPSWLAPLAVLACMGAAAGYVLTNNPTDASRDPLGPCVFKALTGLDCPGCGGTRMVWYVLHGDIPQAARHHAIALVALPVVLWLYVVWAARRWFGVTLPSRRIPATVWGGYLVAWLLFTVLRDLPWEPFSLLLV